MNILKETKTWVKEHKSAIKQGAIVVGVTSVVGIGLACLGLTVLNYKTGGSLTNLGEDLIETTDVDVVMDFVKEKGNIYALQDLGEECCVWIQHSK